MEEMRLLKVTHDDGTHLVNLQYPVNCKALLSAYVDAV